MNNPTYIPPHIRMSSVNFNIGFFPNERNSSRVLKPPGGGHTDIFGIKEQERKLQEVLGRTTEQISKTDDGNETVQVVNEKVTDENETPRCAPQKRTRVPPGGFSSGLW